MLFPRVAVGVVAVAFPEAEAFFAKKKKTANPLDGFPGIEMRNDEAERAAVICGERFAVVGVGEENVGEHEIGEGNIGGVALFG